MTAAKYALDLVIGLISIAPAVGDLLEDLTGVNKETLADRLKRARAAIKDLIDTTATDKVRREQLQRILRGE